MMYDELPPFPLENRIRGQFVPRYTAEFVSMPAILEKVGLWSATMQKFFNHPNSSYDIFYTDTKTMTDQSVSPFYSFSTKWIRMEIPVHKYFSSSASSPTRNTTPPCTTSPPSTTESSLS